MAISSVGLANLGFWGSLPMGFANYGGDTQIYNVPDYINTNINLGFNSQALASLNAPFTGAGCCIPQPPIPDDLAEQLAGALWQPVIEGLAKNNVSSISATIQSTKAKLNSKLQTEGISEEDKKKVKELLERLDEQERKLKELQESEGLTNDEIYERSKEIEKAMRDIAAETAQLDVTPKKNEPQGANEAEAENENENENQAQQAQSQNQSQQAQQEVQGNQNPGFFVDPQYAPARAELEAQMQQAIDEQTGGVRSAMQIAQQFRDAIEGWGTDDETFNNICSQINKDNVMDLMLAYNRFQSTENGESFMEAFMWDADHGQKAKYGRQIADALKEKAVEVGVFDECRADFKEIYEELDDSNISNDISENFDNIVEKIAIAMDQPEYAKPDKSEKMSFGEAAARTVFSPFTITYDICTGGFGKAWDKLCDTGAAILDGFCSLF